MIKLLHGEVWKQLKLNSSKTFHRKYAVSSLGRIASYLINIEEDGKLLKGSMTSGYRTINLHTDNSNETIYLHREVAKHFCKKTSPKEKYVIHLNHKKADNHVDNLKLATLQEVNSHQQNSPSKIAYKIRQANHIKGLKLSLSQVKTLKEIINNPKRKFTYKQLAEKYGVSEMTLYRIRSGENWSKIKS